MVTNSSGERNFSKIKHLQKGTNQKITLDGRNRLGPLYIANDVYFF